MKHHLRIFHNKKKNTWHLQDRWTDNGKRHAKSLESFGKQKPIRYKPLLLQGDVIEKLEEIPDNSIDLAFADPPYNKGIDYKITNDKKRWDEYINWCGEWIKLTKEKLKRGGSFYLMNYPRQSAFLQVRYLENLLDYRKTIRWGYESNVGMSPTNFTTASRDILFYTKGENYTFNGDKIVIPYRNPNDKRIKELIKKGKKGKVPYDWWFFDFNLTKNVSREKIINVVGQTINTPPNQLPEELIKRIILVSSNRGDTVLSLFAGSGTDLVVCSDLQCCRRAIGIELNPNYCKFIKKRLERAFDKKITNLENVEQWNM